MNTSFRFLLAAFVVLLGFSACGKSDTGDSALVCELGNQCIVAYRDGMYANDYDDNKRWCECEVPSAEDDGPCYNGEFHTGECDQGKVIAYCDASQDRSRFFYENIGAEGAIIRTHEEVLSLYRTCDSIDNGNFTLVSPRLCDSDSECDNGIICDGKERCVTEESCSFNFCTQAVCKPAAEPFCPQDQTCNPTSDMCL